MYFISAHPNSAFHPGNLSAYELSDVGVGETGWREYIDYHGVPGWIINDRATPDGYTLRFPIEGDLSDLLPHQVSLKIESLVSYEGMGAVTVSMCGLSLINREICSLIDGLRPLRRESIPSVDACTLRNEHLSRCSSLDPKDRTVDITYAPNKVNGNGRGHKKFKLLRVELCRRA